MSFDTGTGLGRGFALEGLVRPQETVLLPNVVWRNIRSFEAMWRIMPIIGRVLEDETCPPVDTFPTKKLSLHWGYWQSHDYFAAVTSDVGDRLHEWLALGKESRTASCGVHVRRGDYVNDAGAAATLGAQPVGYYRRGIARMKQAGITNFTVYTDDREWVADHLLSDDVQLAPESDAMSDFKGLANSAAVIMSNSSFSWWAAYLASRRGAPVVGPASWFKNESLNATRLMREEWMRL